MESSSMSGYGARHRLEETARLSENEGDGSQGRWSGGQYPPCIDSAIREEDDRSFSPIPECSWKCARVRRQKTFIGRTRVEKFYDIPWWWPNWLVLRSAVQAESFFSVDRRYIDPRCLYREVSKETSEEELPPLERYVVLGIFGDRGNLLREEVIYIGNARSKHLYRGIRHLFRVPILREITSFGLYKCDQGKRVHVRVDLSKEDKDRLHSLFDTITTWSRYHSMKRITKGFAIYLLFSYSWWLVFPFLPIITWWFHHAKVFYEQVTLSLYFGMSPRRPEVEDEDAWCDWLQENLNGGSEDPSIGQYSIEVIVGWSRERILEIVVIPLIMFLSCTTVFALVWSFNVGAHHGNVSAGFSIASYFAGLAGASVALIGFFGGSLAYK